MGIARAAQAAKGVHDNGEPAHRVVSVTLEEERGIGIGVESLQIWVICQECLVADTQLVAGVAHEINMGGHFGYRWAGESGAIFYFELLAASPGTTEPI